MKKILVITPFFYPHIGGSERYMEELYVFLKKKHRQVSIDVLCYNTDNSPESESYRGLNVVRIPCWTILPGQFLLPKPLPLLKFLNSHKSYDLVHTSTRFFDSSWWAPLYAKLTKTKIVLTDHCAYHPRSNNSFIDLIIRVVEATIVRFSLHFYDSIYVESKKTGEFLKQTFGVSSTLAYPGLSNENPILNNTSNKRVKVVYIGRMIESKGVRILFDIAEKIPQVDFVFAGAGPLESLLKKHAGSNILILGGVSKEKVAEIIQGADILAYPSWHSEGLPMALVEAAEAGIAVLATDTGAIDELIVNGKTGMLVKPKNIEAFENALRALVGDSALRLKLGIALQSYAKKNFSWETAANLIAKEIS
jgi:phosphatidylinositol alpha-mannosyltransferase